MTTIDTPRTDHEEYEGKFSGFCNVAFARQLEREIVVVKAERDAWNARYEKLRRLNPRQFHNLWDRNMKGENYDEMVDKL